MPADRRGLLARSLPQENIGDLADKASLDLERSLYAKVASMRWQDQREAEREAEIAETRRKAGTFGTCEDCGELIPSQRLKAVPNAVKCVECKGKEETWLFAHRRGMRH